MDLEFSGEVWFWRGPSPFHFVTVPEDESAELKALSAAVTYGWGMIPVEVRSARRAARRRCSRRTADTSSR